MKAKFKEYLNNTNLKGSKKASSYLRAIELLDIILKKEANNKLKGYNSIYDITDINVVDKLYEFIIKEQRKTDGIFKDKEPSSYWKKGFYSAALKSYMSFLENKYVNKGSQNSKYSDYSLRKPLSDKILIAFKKWYNSNHHKEYEDYYLNEIEFNNLRSKSDNDLISFFVQFKKDGGKIQSTDNRLIDKFEEIISNSISDFRKFVLEPFSPDFDELKWLNNLKDFKYFGIGTATIYLNRVDKNKYHPFNKKVRDAFNLLSNIKLPSSEIKAYSIVSSLSKKMIELYNSFDNYYQTDAFTQFIIGEEEGIVLINEWLNDDLIENELFSINKFLSSLDNCGLIFSKRTISRFISSLLTKPFVILSGLSGSGKTKLAQAFVQWICKDESQYSIVPVGADWTNREPLLGFPNALKPDEYIKPDNGALDVIIRANENPDLPFFLILDEMNLSHVERYFADFLSVMESHEQIPLFAEGTVNNGVPSKLTLPSNLFIEVFK